MRFSIFPAFIKRRQDAPSDSDTGSGLLTQVNRELYKRNAELAIRNKTLALLRKLDEISMASVGMEDMAQQVTIAIGQEFGYELVAIAVIEGTGKQSSMRWLSVTSPVQNIINILKETTLKDLTESLKTMGVALKVLSTNKSKVIEGYKEIFPEHFSGKLAKNKSGKELKSTLIYPLSLGSQALGVLVLTASRNLNNLSEHEREAISGIIGLVSLAIYKAKIYEDLQKTTEDLREANSRLAQLDKAKSEFLSIASHQLYTPLTAIKGYLSMIQEGDYGKLSQKQNKVMDILYASSERLIELIKNLLDVSRIESGRLELSLESVDLNKTVKELVTELSPNARKKQLQLNLLGSTEEMPHVVADAQRIRQVLLNLVDNAIKYTNKGKVDVKLAREGEMVVFSVCDTGKGISAEEINRLFTKFTRVGGAEKYNTDGSGLGLYVARKIVREHHGEIMVDSPGLGRGSMFLIKLPSEGTQNSLLAGTKVNVGIKAGEVGE